MIRYTCSAEGITPGMLGGFFSGWPRPPAPETHLKILEGSDAVVLAVDDGTGKVVGFITAVTDGILTAYIPLLEVLPDYRRKGIGGELVRRMLDRLRNLYAVDLICDPEVQRFYERFGMNKATGMMLRRLQGLPGGK